MSNKASLSNTELELTQRIQMFFPRGVIPTEILAQWNGCSGVDLTATILDTFSKPRLSRSGNSLKSTLARLRDRGYLDTSFESKETHRLTIKSLSKEEAIERYRQSGGGTWVWDELEKNMPYTIPTTETLDVMMMGFGRSIKSGTALDEMDALGVRTLTKEEIIHYGTAFPSHQEKNFLGSLDKFVMDSNPHAAVLEVYGGKRDLDARLWVDVWDDWYRFPVVSK
ncbi:MAG: hypothetical protein Q7K40_04900 [bacterium]|nr:hypothetical protein [bacterium]